MLKIDRTLLLKGPSEKQSLTSILKNAKNNIFSFEKMQKYKPILLEKVYFMLYN